MDTRQVYEERLEAQLKVWAAELALLRAKAARLGSGAKTGLDESIGHLQGRQHEAQTALRALRTAGDDAWEELKAGSETVWADAKTAFQGAASRFR